MDKNKLDGGSTDESDDSLDESEEEEENGMTWTPDIQGKAKASPTGHGRD